MLGTHGHLGVRVLYRATPAVYNGHLRELVTLTPIAERLAMELSLPVLNGRFKSVAAGIRKPNLLLLRRTL